MTPSELAKVREALLRFMHDDDPDIHDRNCPMFDPSVGSICCCYVGADNDVITDALAILDREAGRKTRIQWGLAHPECPENVNLGPYFDTEEEASACACGIAGGRYYVVRVTESWEEPKP